MASTYSPTLRIELIGTGDQSGLWGDTTNTNLGALIEQAITGVESIPMTDADYTLTALNGSVDEARNIAIIFTSFASLTGSRNIFIPAVDKTYIVKNSTTGGQNLVVKTSGGTGYTVPNGKTVMVYCDGTDVFAALDYTNTLTTPTLTATDATITNLTATNLTLGSGTTGTGSYVRQVSPTLTTPTINTPTINGATIATSTFSGTSVTTTSLTVGGSANNSSITMVDSDEGNRVIHCNSNLIGFLTQGGGWGAYCDDNGNWTAAGNVTAYSDERLKTDVVTFQNALAAVEQMRGVAFIKDGQAQVGVIAQEMQRVLPQVVQENADGYLSVAYGNIVGVLIEAIKELSAEVKALKGE